MVTMSWFELFNLSLKDYSLSPASCGLGGKSIKSKYMVENDESFSRNSRHRSMEEWENIQEHSILKLALNSEISWVMRKVRERCCNCWLWRPFTFYFPGSTPMTSGSSKASQRATKSSLPTMTGMTRTRPCRRAGSLRSSRWTVLARWSSQWGFWALTGGFAPPGLRPSSTCWRTGAPTTMIWCECRWGCYRSVLKSEKYDEWYDHNIFFHPSWKYF